MSLFSDLQFPRHLTEGAGQAKGEGSPVVPDGALEGGKEIEKGQVLCSRVPGGGPSLSPCSSQSQSLWSGIGAHLDVVALPHAGAQRMQSSGQVGRTAALSKVVGDAAGEAQRSESATQTWTGQNGQVPGALCLPPRRARTVARRG